MINEKNFLEDSSRLFLLIREENIVAKIPAW